jgi:hypothetical protein
MLTLNVTNRIIMKITVWLISTRQRFDNCLLKKFNYTFLNFNYQCVPKSRIFNFLKRDCGTIPVAEIISGKIEFFSKLQRFLIATESSKYLLIFVLYVCVIRIMGIWNSYI